MPTSFLLFSGLCLVTLLAAGCNSKTSPGASPPLATSPVSKTVPTFDGSRPGPVSEYINIRQSPFLPLIFQKGLVPNLVVDSDNQIVSGDAVRHNWTWLIDLERPLVIQRLAPRANSFLVHLGFDKATRYDCLTASSAAVLVGANGTEHKPFATTVADKDDLWLHVCTVDEAGADVPRNPSPWDALQLTYIYALPTGCSISQIVVDGKPIATFSPPLCQWPSR